MSMLGVSLLVSSMAFAEGADTSGKKMTVQEFMASLHFKKGKIDLPNGMASLNLPESFRYLDPADTERVLVDAWNNPPGNKSLGMILPTDVSIVGDNSWGVIITYEEDGHVKDDDAESINYDDLLKKMQEATTAANAERKKRGYDSISLVGWAEKPTYDMANHKLYWAKELSVEGFKENTLNYNIRVLGRKGVLILNAVAGMSQLNNIKSEMQKVLAFTEFRKGNTYADFDSSIDKTAEYGIAALIAGGVAAKLGLFAKLFALLVAFKKFVIIGVVGIWVAIKKFLGINKNKQVEV